MTNKGYIQVLREVIREELLQLHEISAGGVQTAIALISVIPTLVSLSDRRLKHDIVEVGSSPSGISVYEFSYNKGGRRYLGTMGQELLDTHPDAVFITDDGWYGVDYGKIDVDLQVLPIGKY